MLWLNADINIREFARLVTRSRIRDQHEQCNVKIFHFVLTIAAVRDASSAECPGGRRDFNFFPCSDGQLTSA